MFRTTTPHRIGSLDFVIAEPREGNWIAEVAHLRIVVERFRGDRGQLGSDSAGAGGMLGSFS